MTLLDSLREPYGASVAVEIAGTRVSAAAVERRTGRALVSAHASEPLPPGAVVPGLATPNIADRDAVTGALGRVLDRLGARPRRIALAVPDVVARVSLVRFEKVPSRAQDLDQLIRWQVKKAAPFPIEDAQVTYVPGWAAPEGQEFVVAAARRDVVEEYESVCAAAGAHAGLVDLATFNIANAVIAGGHADGSGGASAGAGDRATSRGDLSTGSGSSRAASRGDWLLVNAAPEYASIAIMRGDRLIFFRNRAAEAEGTIEDVVHQSAMYYEDRLKGAGFARVVLAGAAAQDGAGLDVLQRALEERLATAVELVDPRPAAAIADRIAAAPPLLDLLSPLVGLLVRGREVAA